MKAKLVGLEPVDYIKRGTGERVQGVKLHTMGKNANVEGISVKEIWISARSENLFNMARQLPLDTFVDIDYNNYGSVIDIAVVSNK